MKTIIVHISIVDSKDPGVQEIKLEKTAPSEEIEVLASGMSTIFLKSKDALGIANKKGRRVVAIGRSIKK
jgi:hypothetical protein